MVSYFHGVDLDILSVLRFSVSRCKRIIYRLVGIWQLPNSIGFGDVEIMYNYEDIILLC